MNIAGKRALVLGAARGIGRAIARSLADQGVRLILPWLDWPESVAELQGEFGGDRDRHLLMRTDLRQANEVAELMAAINEQFGGLEIVVNNIERGGMPIVHGGYDRDINRDQWQLEMETTLRAKWLVFDQALPLLRRSETATVVNVSSIAGIVGRSGPAGLLFSDGYAAANRGVRSLTETWARIGAPNIRVNELMLGLIDSRHGPGTWGWDLLSEEQRRGVLRHTLLRRTGRPEEVAQAALFLIRDADFLTGSVLRLDGGYVVGGEAPSVMPDGVL